MSPLEADDGPWADAVLAATLFAVDRRGLGGVLLRAGPGPQRDAVCGWLPTIAGTGAPVLRLPSHVTEDRLLGGLSLAATLGAGRLVTEKGLLAQADDGVLVVAMAERLAPNVTSHVCAALDRGELTVERDGVTAKARCRVGVLALDEGVGDERPPDALADRLAFHVDLGSVDARAPAPAGPDAVGIAWARARLRQVEVPSSVVEALCAAADALGISSLRAVVLAAAAARAHAALEGRREASAEDAAAAARLVLGPRATRRPETTADAETETESETEASAEAEKDADADAEANAPLDEVVLAAAKSGIPEGLLDALATGRATRRGGATGTSGGARVSTRGGRPAGTRPGTPQPGERLALVDTLRAAAPWQRLRRGATASRRIEVRKDDLRVVRFQERTETTVIFAVDASGSAALQRLAEAKGAVEQVLADCHVRRDHVALLAFRGTSAALLLPPTRSLARVKKCLEGLAGGGATPLASGLDAALSLAADATKRGRTPVLVVMTDGRANVARDGSPGVAAASADALATARAVRAAGVRALFLDTSPRPQPRAKAVADAMGARYLPLPYLDAHGISAEVRSLAAASP